MTTELSKFNSGLLPESEITALESLYPEIRHDFKVKTIFRTETEARTSVLNHINHPTPHAKYWQSVREQQVHFENLVWLSFDYRKLKVELKKLERDLTKEENELERELLEIEIERKQYDIALCEKVAKERSREIKQWSKIKGELLKHHSDKIDTEDVDTDGRGQLVSHTKRFILRYLNAGQNIPPADLINLKGCAVTAVMECRANGVWDEVVADLSLTKPQREHLEG